MMTFIQLFNILILIFSDRLFYNRYPTVVYIL